MASSARIRGVRVLPVFAAAAAAVQSPSARAICIDLEKRLLERKAEADRAYIAAHSQAGTDKSHAEGHAEATRIDAQATSDYERLVGQHRTEPMLRWQEIEAMRSILTSPNSKIIFYGGARSSPGTMLELK